MGTKPLYHIIFDWGVRCFGDEHMRNPRIRALRLVEEAIELCQAVGVDQAMVAKQVSEVYARPHGDKFQELGGVMVTTIAFAMCVGLNPDTVLEAEVRRCLSKTPEEFAKRNKAKMQIG